MNEFTVLPGREAASLAFEEAVAATPRNMELIEAGWRTIARGMLMLVAFIPFNMSHIAL